MKRKVSLQIKVAISFPNQSKGNKNAIRSILRKIRHLEIAVANIDPVKQVLETVKKETVDTPENFYDV